LQSFVPSGRTRHGRTKRPLKRVERLSDLRAPRTTRLPKQAMKNMKSKPANYRYERGSLGVQVSAGAM
jgi:hypothetical protein